MREKKQARVCSRGQVKKTFHINYMNGKSQVAVKIAKQIKKKMYYFLVGNNRGKDDELVEGPVRRN